MAKEWKEIYSVSRKSSDSLAGRDDEAQRDIQNVGDEIRSILGLLTGADDVERQRLVDMLVSVLKDRAELLHGADASSLKQRIGALTSFDAKESVVLAREALSHIDFLLGRYANRDSSSGKEVGEGHA